LGIDWSASLTYGNIYNIEKTVLDEYGSITGTEVLEKDAIAEIPPFETNLILSWQEPGLKVIPAVSFRYAAPQNQISEAYYEQPSEGFFLMNASVKYQPLKYLTLQGGVNNLLDTDYYEHLNRRVIGTTADMPEPGRVWYVQLNLRIQ
jgi:iron complex outermembrane receptor protein